MASVWLVRHAQTLLHGVCYGQSDVPVELEPAQAARRIALEWAQTGLARPPEIWSSPWVRAESVALELARVWHVPCQVDARLSELCFGVWEGRPYAEIERTDAARFQHWLQHYEQEAPPRGETVAELRARVAAWLEERRGGTTPVLAVTHAGVVRTARAVTSGRPYSAVVGEEVPHLRLERVL